MYVDAFVYQTTAKLCGTGRKYTKYLTRRSLLPDVITDFISREAISLCTLRRTALSRGVLDVLLYLLHDISLLSA